MPFTDGLGVELLTLEAPAVDAPTTLRTNLSVTRQQMMAESSLARATHGLTLNTATRIGNGLGHDMKILAEVFKHIAPTRKLAMPGEEGKPDLVSEILKRAAEPPK